MPCTPLWRKFWIRPCYSQFLPYCAPPLSLIPLISPVLEHDSSSVCTHKCSNVFSWFHREEEEIKQGIFVTSIGASILSLLAIAFNRFFVILHPFNYRAKMSNTVIVVVMVTIWVYSMIFGALPIAGWNANSGDCSRIFPGLARTYVFVLSLHVVVALVIILGLYIAIFVKVRTESLCIV